MESPVRSRLIKRATQRALVLWGLAALGALLLALLASSLYDAFADRAAEQENAQRQLLSQQIASEVSTAIAPYRSQLVSLAAEPTLPALFGAGDQAGLDRFLNEHKGEFMHVLALRALPASTAEVDPDATPPLTYASLDMLSKVKSTGTPADAEVHMHGTPNAHVVIVAPVLNGSEVVGVLHLALATAVYENVLDGSAVGPEYYIELRQPIPGSPPLVLAKAGSAANSDEAVVAGIGGTRWVIALRGEAQAGLDLGWLLPLLGAAALAAGIVLFGARYLRRVRPAGGGANAEIEYQGAIKTILSGANPGLESLLPGSLQRSALALDPMAGEIPADDVTEIVKPPPAAKAPEGKASALAPGAKGAVAAQAAGIELTETADADPALLVPAVIFRSYDIRGIVGETLSEEGVYEIGRALGSIAADADQPTVVVARDGRNSSKSLQDALIAGLRSTGRDVLDIGLTPTPVLYFATHYLDARSGVMVTGSHNPGNYNGLKMVINGETLSGAAIQAIRERIIAQDYHSGAGQLQRVEIIPDYIRRISEDIPVSLGNPLTVVVDCGNGVPGIVAPHILRAIGHDVIELYCDVDGDFPNHHPDPSQPENLHDLIETVRNENADLGLAFDGDGDRLGVVDGEGNIIWPDQQMMLYARDVLSRNPGAKIIYDVKCSGRLGKVIRDAGGEPIMSKTGHSLIKAKMKETGALLAGEMSGHLFFKERWYGFDDALYAAARLLEILIKEHRPSAEVFAELPSGVATPELKIDMPESRHQPFMKQVLEAALFPKATITTIDGLRVDFADSWGLIRPSNTTPCLVLRFEGDDVAALGRVQDAFRDLLLGIDAKLQLPF